jgi:drug/metabolite transporter (DMT)-like permease
LTIKAGIGLYFRAPVRQSRRMVQTQPIVESPLRGLALRFIAIALLSLMVAMVKLASTRGVDLVEIMFFRQALAVPAVLAWVMLGPGIGSLRTARMGKHFMRSIIGVLGMFGTLGVVMLLPLAEATTLQFTVPIFATILSTLILKEAAGWHRWSAVVVGFIGVLIVTRPGQGGHFPLFGGLVGLYASAMVALVAIHLRDLGRTEAAATSAFWFSLLSVPLLGIAYPFFAKAHDPLTWAILASIGLVGGIGQIALTAALRWAPVSTVVPMDYSGLIWATLFGWALFGALPSAETWFGAPLIMGSGLYIVWREHKLHRRNTDTAIAAAD